MVLWWFHDNTLGGIQGKCEDMILKEEKGARTDSEHRAGIRFLNMSDPLTVSKAWGCSMSGLGCTADLPLTEVDVDKSVDDTWSPGVLMTWEAHWEALSTGSGMRRAQQLLLIVTMIIFK